MEGLEGKPKIFKTAFVFNALALFIMAIVFVLSFKMIGLEKEAEKRYLYELSSLVTGLLTFVNIAMLGKFLKNTKTSKLYFMCLLTE